MKIKQTLPLLLLAFIWGCYYVASQRAVTAMSVFSVGVLVRFLTMLLLGVIMWKSRQLPLLLQVKPVLPKLIMIGVLGFMLDLTAFIGLTLSPAGSGTALLKCDILFVNLISVWLYKERFTKMDWCYSLIMLAGVFMVIGVNPLHFEVHGAGSIFFILSALFVSINAFLIKNVQLNPVCPVEDNVIAFYNNIITLFFFTVASCIMGVTDQILHPSNWYILIPVAIAGIGQTLIYLVYYYDLRHYPVWIVKIFLLLMPIVSALISFVLFGERIEKTQCIGIAIVLVGASGILLEQRKKAK